MTPLAAATAALWILVLTRLGPFLRKRGDLVFFAALAGAAAAVLMAPAVSDTVFAGGAAVPTVGSLIMLALGLVRAAIVRAVVLPAHQAPVLQRGLLQTAAAMTAYCSAYACAAIVGAVPLRGLPAVPEAQVDVGVFVFTTTLSIYVIFAAVQIALVCLRYVPQMASGLFRIGFTTVAVGCGSAVAGMAANVLREAGDLTSLGLDAGPALEASFEWFAGCAGVLLPLGLALPSLTRWADAWQVYERYCLLRLDRVWRRAADTNLVMDALTAPLSGVVSRDPRSRLHRALVEIMDSELAAGGSLLTSSESRLVKKSEEAFYA